MFRNVPQDEDRTLLRRQRYERVPPRVEVRSRSAFGADVPLAVRYGAALDLLHLGGGDPCVMGDRTLTVRVVPELAEFLRATAGHGDLSRPLDGVLARRQFQHGEPARKFAARINFSAH
jgi:hypothetical protein